jgi:hypothetical protein
MALDPPIPPARDVYYSVVELPKISEAQTSSVTRKLKRPLPWLRNLCSAIIAFAPSTPLQSQPLLYLLEPFVAGGK